MLSIQRLLPAALLLSFAVPASAQVELVAFESFDYAFPGLIHDMSGGTGWSSNWWGNPGGSHDGVVVQANAPTNPTNPFPYPGADGVGNYAQQANQDQGIFRFPDAGANPDVADPNSLLFGVDDTTMWFSWSIQGFLINSPDHYGGFSLNQQGVAEKLFMGSPWQANSWGVDPQTGAPATLIPGTSDTDSVRLVVRIDHMAGDERVRMWVDPAVPHPVCPAPLDIMIPDLQWNEVRFQSGGNDSLFYYDNLVIEKGVPLAVGSSVCGPAETNSTGGPATLTGSGTADIARNDLVITASGAPADEFGYFIASDGWNAGSIPPGGNGRICMTVGPNLGRYQELVQSSGTSGCFSIAIDNGNIRTGGAPYAVMTGDTWYFQGWFRDGTSSNTTDGLEVTFN